jgi:hypothetical protein
MDQLLAEEVNKAARMHEFVLDTLAGPYPDNLRSRLFGAFMAVCLSHHEAILTLMQNERLGGSALALLRSLVESAYRGVYVGLIATDADVQKIANDEFKYPYFNDIANSIDQHMASGDLYQLYGGDAWKLLNDLTHTGVVQLASRLSAAGKMGSHYETETLRRTVASATSALIRIAMPFLIEMRGPDAAALVSARYVSIYPLQPAGGVPAKLASGSSEPA